MVNEKLSNVEYAPSAASDALLSQALLARGKTNKRKTKVSLFDGIKIKPT